MSASSVRSSTFGMNRLQRKGAADCSNHIEYSDITCQWCFSRLHSGMPKRPPASVGAPPLQANVAGLRALAHPLRLRILELFAEAPRTTKQVAELLDQPPTRLYHHVAALERAGILRLKETRKNRGTVEKWYESVARTVSGAQVATSQKKSA